MILIIRYLFCYFAEKIRNLVRSKITKLTFLLNTFYYFSYKERT